MRSRGYTPRLVSLQVRRRLYALFLISHDRSDGRNHSQQSSSGGGTRGYLPRLGLCNAVSRPRRRCRVQSIQGGVRAMVKDPSGVLSGAEATLTNEATTQDHTNASLLSLVGGARRANNYLLDAAWAAALLDSCLDGEPTSGG